MAKDNNCHSIAFPLISAGIYGYPKNQAWRKALQACNDFINKNPSYDIDILFAVLNDQILQMGLDELKNQTKRVDAESTSKGKKDNSRSISKVNEEETLLEELNGKALHDAIEAVRIVDKIQWGGGEIMDNGARQWPYPIYPDGIFKSFSILESDKNYVENYEQCKTVLPSEMNVQQIRTMLTYMSRGERFCDGFISRYLGNKTLLKLLLRLDDLLIRYYEKHDLDVDKRYDEPIIQSKMD